MPRAFNIYTKVLVTIRCYTIEQCFYLGFRLPPSHGRLAGLQTRPHIHAKVLYLLHLTIHKLEDQRTFFYPKVRSHHARCILVRNKKILHLQSLNTH